jgi:hypothetical protein
MDKPSVAFITLTNNGYLKYTKNCIASLNKLNLKYKLQCFCSDDKGYDNLKKEYDNTLKIEQNITGHSHLMQFRNRDFGELMKVKVLLILECLKKYDYVCYTDGDIAFTRDGLFEHLFENIGDNDILMQKNRLGNNQNGSGCAGFMFIKSNDKTKKMFDLSLIENKERMNKSFIVKTQWCDQEYVNHCKDDNIASFKLLNCYLFPSGHVINNAFCNIDKNKAYLYHFNFMESHKKIHIMKQRGLWFL